MRIIDLTHLITEKMPVYPGTERPKLLPANTVEEDGFRETLLTVFSHTGTHMDAPLHLFAGRAGLDSYPADKFIGSLMLVDCRASMKLIETDIIDIRKADDADFLLFYTGWDRYWNKSGYFSGFPVCSEGVIDYCVSSGKKGVGFDTISADPVGSLENHRRLLENDVLIIENLTNLGELLNGSFLFSAMPLKFEKSDGAPVRAIAMQLC